MASLPYERQVFTLDSPDTFFLAYDPSQNHLRTAHLDVVAEQIATLCATLGEYPTIRYRSENEKMLEFANAVQQKLIQYKAKDATMGEGGDKAKSVLLLLDRGFDAVSPLLHELTFQAMAHDLLKIENGVFEYEVQTPATEWRVTPAPTQKARLDENDDLWTELRHQHIAAVTKSIAKKFKDFAEQARVKDSNLEEQTLVMMNEGLPSQKELNAYTLHFNIAEQCMNAYNRESRDKLCTVEQNLAMGVDAEGERIKDHMRNIVPLLLDTAIAVEDKLRVIMLYILHKNGYTRETPDTYGITEENLDKLLSHALIPSKKKKLITNMQHLNLQITQDQNRVRHSEQPTNFLLYLASKLAEAGRPKNIAQQRRERSDATYANSRWTPYVKDLMEDITEDKLSSTLFPALDAQRNVAWNTVVRSTREPGPVVRNHQLGVRPGPRLIVFILGGVCYSELRSAYEVTQSNAKRWEVFIGSDHIVTPKEFLRDLEMRARQEDEQ